MIFGIRPVTTDFHKGDALAPDLNTYTGYPFADQLMIDPGEMCGECEKIPWVWILQMLFISRMAYMFCSAQVQL